MSKIIPIVEHVLIFCVTATLTFAVHAGPFLAAGAQALLTLVNELSGHPLAKVFGHDGKS